MLIINRVARVIAEFSPGNGRARDLSLYRNVLENRRPLTNCQSVPQYLFVCPFLCGCKISCSLSADTTQTTMSGADIVAGWRRAGQVSMSSHLPWQRVKDFCIDKIFTVALQRACLHCLLICVSSKGFSLIAKKQNIFEYNTSFRVNLNYNKLFIYILFGYISLTLNMLFLECGLGVTFKNFLRKTTWH